MKRLLVACLERCGFVVAEKFLQKFVFMSNLCLHLHSTIEETGDLKRSFWS